MERMTVGAENYGIALKLCKFKISVEKMVTMSRGIINEHLQKLLVSYFLFSCLCLCICPRIQIHIPIPL